MYMTHMLVLYVWSAVFAQVLPGMGKPYYLILNIVAMVSTTVALSAVCYRFIEAPGMKLGSLLVQRMAPARREYEAQGRVS
jgi:peptidoglycan/LPS O-acetylase OafA/YrhL